MKYTVDQIGQHVFEVSGCGVAPFQFVGYFQIPSPELAGQNPDAYYNQMKSAPCAVGCCRHCGMPLVHNFIIKDANGKLFAVGCECVNKTGDSGLIQAVDTEKKRQEKLTRAAKKEAKRITKAEEKKARIQKMVDEFSAANPGIVEWLVAEVAKENCQPIFKSFHNQLFMFGNLSYNQVVVIEKAIEKASEPVLESNHIGVVGKRQIFSQVKIEAIVTVPCMSFSYYDRPSIDLYIMKDKDGNCLFYKSKKAQITKDGHVVDKGDTVSITATVKEHGEYKGIKQTIVERPKWTVEV